MTARPLIVPGCMPSRDRNGRAMAGKLRFYLPNTTSPATIYTSNALSVAHPFPIVSDSAGRWPAMWLDDANTVDCAWSDLATDTLISSFSGIAPANDAVLASTALAQGSADAAAASAATAAGYANSDYAQEAADSATAAASSASAASTSAAAAASSASAASTSAGAAASSATSAATSAANAAAIVGFNPTAVHINGGGLVSGGGDISGDRTLTVAKSSQAQAQVGTDDTTAMTPLRTADAILALGNLKLAVVSKAASYSHTSAESKKLYEWSGSLGSAVTHTIDPTIVGAGGWVGEHNTGTGPFRIVPSSGTIDGRAAIVVYPGERFLIRSDGTNLRTIGRAARWPVEIATPAAAAAVNMELVFTANNGAVDPELGWLEYDYEGTGTTATVQVKLKQGGAYQSGGTAYSGTYVNLAAMTAATISGQGSIAVATSASAALEVEVRNPLAAGAGAICLFSRSKRASNGQDDAQLAHACANTAGALQGVQFTSTSITATITCYINRSIL